MEQYISKLESERFGFKIARIDLFTMPVTDALTELKKANVRLVITRVKSWDIEQINILEECAFKLMDTQLTYVYKLNRFSRDLIVTSRQFVVRDFRAEDAHAIVQIAGESFDNYGHYAADKRLDKKKCVEAYIDWARRTCIDRNAADKIFVAEHSKKVVGYLSFKISKKNDQTFASGVMGAVSSQYRDQGIFRAIVDHSLIWGKELSMAWHEHNVITANFPVNHSFINAGFKPENSFITFHGWIN